MCVFGTLCVRVCVCVLVKALRVKGLYVTKLDVKACACETAVCTGVLCERVVFKRVECDKVVCVCSGKAYVKELRMKEWCMTKFHVTPLCVCERTMCYFLCRCSVSTNAQHSGAAYLSANPGGLPISFCHWRCVYPIGDLALSS